MDKKKYITVLSIYNFKKEIYIFKFNIDYKNLWAAAVLLHSLVQLFLEYGERNGPRPKVLLHCN